MVAQARFKSLYVTPKDDPICKSWIRWTPAVRNFA